MEQKVETKTQPVPKPESTAQKERAAVPDWVKNTATWWSEGAISEGEFVTSLEYLINQKIINVAQPEDTSLDVSEIAEIDEETSTWFNNWISSLGLSEDQRDSLFGYDFPQTPTEQQLEAMSEFLTNPTGASLETVTLPPPPPVIECNSYTATIRGTENTDVLVGTQNRDVINGLGGNDVIYGLDGDDVICGGDGDDSIFGLGGNDTILGEDGNDLIYGEEGDDNIQGGDGRDTIFGNEGNDRITGGEGNDFLRGDGGRDQIYGGEDSDTISGGEHDDEISGNEGNDTLYGESGSDTIFGGSGNDLIHVGVAGEIGTCDVGNGESGDDHLRSHPTSCARLDGGPNDDILQGRGSLGQRNQPGSYMWGGEGNDTLSGYTIDTLDGGGGTDRCSKLAGISGHDVGLHSLFGRQTNCER